MSPALAASRIDRLEPLAAAGQNGQRVSCQRAVNKVEQAAAGPRSRHVMPNGDGPQPPSGGCARESATPCSLAAARLRLSKPHPVAGGWQMHHAEVDEPLLRRTAPLVQSSVSTHDSRTRCSHHKQGIPAFTPSLPSLTTKTRCPLQSQHSAPSSRSGQCDLPIQEPLGSSTSAFNFSTTCSKCLQRSQQPLCPRKPLHYPVYQPRIH